MSSYNIIFAAGGTGGHLYPAIAVAEQLKLLSPNSRILFVGTKEKLESKVIPRLGYSFKTIWVSGFNRRLTIKNLMFPIKLVISLFQSIKISMSFKPDVSVGAGAYVSGPIVWMSSLFGSKIVLLEQNSFPGVTNRMLEKKADSIHISFEDSRKYFKEPNKIKLTGNPVRNTLELKDRIEAVKSFGFDENKKILFVFGGSLGAKSLNKAVANNLNSLKEKGIQIIWQTGELYYSEYKNYQDELVKVVPFINDMANAYSACDLLVVRAGATTIAEVAYLGLPVIFVPSRNVAANHQYMNAKSIVDKGAGIIIDDSVVEEKLSITILETIFDNEKLILLKENIKKISKPNAAKDIALDVLRLAQKK